MSHRLVLLAAVALALFGAALPGSAFAQQGNAESTYKTYCAACHRADGAGVPDVLPPLARSEWVTGDPDVLLRILLNGVTGRIEVAGKNYSGSMAGVGAAMKDEEIAAVATYIRSSFGNKAPAVTVAQVRRIRRATAAQKTAWTAEGLKSLSRTSGK